MAMLWQAKAKTAGPTLGAVMNFQQLRIRRTMVKVLGGYAIVGVGLAVAIGLGWAAFFHVLPVAHLNVFRGVMTTSVAIALHFGGNGWLRLVGHRKINRQTDILYISAFMGLFDFGDALEHKQIALLCAAAADTVLKLGIGFFVAGAVVTSTYKVEDTYLGVLPVEGAEYLDSYRGNVGRGLQVMSEGAAGAVNGWWLDQQLTTVSNETYNGVYADAEVKCRALTNEFSIANFSNARDPEIIGSPTVDGNNYTSIGGIQFSIGETSAGMLMPDYVDEKSNNNFLLVSTYATVEYTPYGRSVEIATAQGNMSASLMYRNYTQLNNKNGYRKQYVLGAICSSTPILRNCTRQDNSAYNCTSMGSNWTSLGTLTYGWHSDLRAGQEIRFSSYSPALFNAVVAQNMVLDFHSANLNLIGLEQDIRRLSRGLVRTYTPQDTGRLRLMREEIQSDADLGFLVAMSACASLYMLLLTGLVILGIRDRAWLAVFGSTADIARTAASSPMYIRAVQGNCAQSALVIPARLSFTNFGNKTGHIEMVEPNKPTDKYVPGTFYGGMHERIDEAARVFSVQTGEAAIPDGLSDWAWRRVSYRAPELCFVVGTPDQVKWPILGSPASWALKIGCKHQSSRYVLKRVLMWVSKEYKCRLTTGTKAGHVGTYGSEQEADELSTDTDDDDDTVIFPAADTLHTYTQTKERSLPYRKRWREPKCMLASTAAPGKDMVQHVDANQSTIDEAKTGPASVWALADLGHSPLPPAQRDKGDRLYQCNDSWHSTTGILR